MTYIEFPFDRIVELHVRKGGGHVGGGDPPPEHKCGSYVREDTYPPHEGVDAALGPPEYSAAFACWMTEDGLYFNPLFGRWWSASDPLNPYRTPSDVPMTGVIRYEIAMRAAVEVKNNPNTLQWPQGTPVTMVSGSGLGLGYTNTTNDPLFSMGIHYTAPHPPNIAVGEIGDLGQPGDVLVSEVAGEYNVEAGGGAALWVQATGALLNLHNIREEVAPPNGWMELDYYTTSASFSITGVCRGSAPPTPEPHTEI